MWIKITQWHCQFKQFLRFCQIKKMSINSRSSTDHKTAGGRHGSLKHLELNTLSKRTPTIGTLSHEFYETCHSIAFIVLVNSHQR